MAKRGRIQPVLIGFKMNMHLFMEDIVSSCEEGTVLNQLRKIPTVQLFIYKEKKEHYKKSS